MFPRSCLRDWLSKSSSSIREPSTTATRVSSACAASINILLVIEKVSAAREGRVARAPDTAPRARATFAARRGPLGRELALQGEAAHWVQNPDAPENGARSER